MSKAAKGAPAGVRAATGPPALPVAWPLPWLAEPWARLWAAWRDDRLGHALLITGPAGIGKRLLAARLGHALLCTAPDTDGSPCGQCADCRLLASGNHPDLVLLTPDPNGKSKEIKADQVRALCESQALTPHRASRKVLQIIPAEGMNLVAANGLLKTLEEPADSTLWVLVSEAPGRLPQTIRSRCQRVALPLPPADTALAWLARQPASAGLGAGVGSDAALLLRLAHGAPLAALALAGTEVGRERLAARAAGLRGFLAVGCGEQDPLELARAWQAGDPSVVLGQLSSWVCDLLRLRADPGVRHLDNPDQREALAPLAARLAPAAAHRYLQRVLWACSLSDATINKQMLYEALLVRWARLAKGGDRG